MAEAAPTDEAGVGADYEYGESLDVHDEPKKQETKYNQTTNMSFLLTLARPKIKQI